jgi:hypothetical protein
MPFSGIRAKGRSMKQPPAVAEVNALDVYRFCKSYRDALLLAYLSRSWLRWHRKDGRGPEAFFQCPSKGLKRHLAMAATTVSRGIKCLEDLGLIEVRRASKFPFHARVRLNWEHFSETAP